MHRPSLRSLLPTLPSWLRRRPRRRRGAGVFARLVTGDGMAPRVVALGPALRARWRRARGGGRALWAAGGLSAATVGAVVVAVTVVAGGSPGGTAGAHRRLPVVADPQPAQRPQASFAASAPPAPALPPAAALPAAPPPAVAAAPSVRPHELFGFAPYWTLDRQGGFDVRHVTTVAYFGLEIGRDGTLSRSGPEWSGYQSQALADLVDRAHGAGARVVLTAKAFDPSVIQALVTDPAVPGRLAGELDEVVAGRNMDGVNIDVEGTDGGQRDGFSALVGAVSRQLHGAHRSWQVTVDTYVGSATNPQSFFDVNALARDTDALFVMAYDMYQGGAASPNSPLTGYQPNVADAIAAYTRAVSPGRVILGLPFYGYDWATVDASPASRAVGGPHAITWATIKTSGWAARWDGAAQSPWASYQVGGQWHEAYYDDAQSLGAKAAAASAAHLRGVGVWALGMDGGDPSLLEALAAGGVSKTSGQKGVAPGPAPPPPSPQPGSAQPGPGSGGSPSQLGGPTQPPPTAQPRPSTTSTSSTTTTTGPPSPGPTLPLPTTPTTAQCKALLC